MLFEHFGLSKSLNMIINDLQQARDIIKKYNAYYHERLLGPDNKRNPRQALEATKSPIAQQMAVRHYAELSRIEQIKRRIAARKLLSAWRHVQSKDTLVTVNPNGAHAAAVAHLINGQTTVKKNMSQYKRKRFLDAMQHNNWRDEIFDDLFILEIAMAAFVRDEINHLQMETVIGLIESTVDYDGRKRKVTPYALLNGEGNLTKKAHDLFIKHLDKFMGRIITSENMEHFIWLLKAFIEITPSENIFYFYDIPSSYFVNADFQPLAIRLYDRQATLWCESGQICHLSASAHDAFRIAVFGLENLFPARVMLGKLTVYDIERGILNDYRPKAGFFPHVDFEESPHDFLQVDRKTAADHDDYHADVSCHVGAIIRGVFKKCIAIIRAELLSKTDKQNASIIWRLVDGEFLYFREENPVDYTDQTVAETFTDGLLYFLTKEDENKVFMTEKGGVTDAGIVCFIHMATNLEDWHTQIKFHPELMILNFKEYFDIAMKLRPFFTEDTIHNILIFRMVLVLSQYIDVSAIHSVWITALKKQWPMIQDRFSIKRNNKIAFLGAIDRDMSNMPCEDYTWLDFMRLVQINLRLTPPLKLITPLIFLSTAYLLTNSFVEATQNRFVKSQVLVPLFQLMTRSSLSRRFGAKGLEIIQKNLVEYLDYTNSQKSTVSSSVLTPAELDVSELLQAKNFLRKVRPTIDIEKILRMDVHSIV